jgi:hypothetical protein
LGDELSGVDEGIIFLGICTNKKKARNSGNKNVFHKGVVAFVMLLKIKEKY